MTARTWLWLIPLLGVVMLALLPSPPTLAQSGDMKTLTKAKKPARIVHKPAPKAKKTPSRLTLGAWVKSVAGTAKGLRSDLSTLKGFGED